MILRDALLAMLPEHVLLAGIVLLLVAEIAALPGRAAAPIALVAVVAAAGAGLWLSATGFTAAPFEGAYAIAPFGSAAKAILLVLAVPILLTAPGDLAGYRAYALVLSSLYGALLINGAESFTILFVGIELMSLPVYALAVVSFRRDEGAEAALKYLVLGGAGSAMLLMGAALVFGSGGDLSLAAFADALVAEDLLARAGVALVVGALFVKAAIAPFHAWAPDVYEAASVPVTAYMAVVVKAAVLFAALRLFRAAALPVELVDLVVLFSLASVVWGNLAAMRQASLRRTIAYSSIAHAGYLFYAFLDPGPGRPAAIAFYAIAYGLSNLLAFAAIPPAEDDAARDRLEDLRGLFSRRPFAAIAIAIAMLSLAGVPPLPGFTAKFFLFNNAMIAGYTAYAVAGLVASYLGLYFYLRVIQILFASPSEAAAGEPRGLRAAALVATVLCLVGTLLLSVLPGWLVDRLAG
ncbi:MAG: NADH-quinone oxidoreductase subunit N [Proteobacteria bacterium]|jgi:NADH-quinone oxidoreductase subunit N|nr:NADH-quinone oxidoreductase subunit N [Pseudomonadota bacterium]